ncbi:MAG: protein-L-isoaspartate(D-aspartate) O-methyltransferase [Bacteroidales bacterium]|nr:protein-L-isoaspartate(D-aspartate) O-methyltransferase [Bacteroidales bacterium]MCF8334418.1 protein-L-isoaspartate(D-aspartate) O-methyltransferase [Bacteroidales bacterium]
MKDSFKHKGMRKKLVEKIRQEGWIHDERILEAMMRIPRHLFLDSSFEEYAYQDRPFPIGNEQTISQPTTVAFQTQLLEVKKNDRILEVGTGSGYQAALLADLGARVFTIERFKSLKEKARKNLRMIGFQGVNLFYGDGYKGLPAYAPFHKILVTAAAPELPDTFFSQLREGGMLVVPFGKGGVQTMKRFIKTQEEIIEENHGDFAFVPLLRDKAE